MNKLILFCLSFVLLTATQLEARRCSWAQRFCGGCNRYDCLTDFNYDGNFYGYVDNINYPDPYCLPLNYYFNYRGRCPRSYRNYHYLLDCVRFTNGQRYTGPTYSCE